MRLRAHERFLCLLLPTLAFSAGARAQESGSARERLYDSLLEITQRLDERWTRFELDGLVVLIAEPDLIKPEALEATSSLIDELLRRFDPGGEIRRELRADPIH